MACFMDEELLPGKGLEPEGGEIAAIDGFALRIGQRAALVPTPGAKVYGLVFFSFSHFRKPCDPSEFVTFIVKDIENSSPTPS